MSVRATRPLIYGYLRVTDAEPDELVYRTERDMRSIADEEGFCLATIFHEHAPGGCAAFAELAEELRRADAYHVVVPSLAHLSSHPLVCEQMLTHLERHAGAQVLTVTPCAAAVNPAGLHRTS